MIQSISPSPLPMTFLVGSARNGADEFIVMQFSTPGGTNVYFLDRETAKQIAAHLTELATGIVIAQPSLASQLADAAMKR